jgi:hypothetical protein
LKNETIKIQNAYLETLKNLDDIKKNNNKFIDMDIKEKQLLNDGEKIYNLWKEYNAKKFFKPRLADEQKNVIHEFLSFIKENSERVRKNILGIHHDQELESLSVFVNRLGSEKIWELYVKFIKDETEANIELIKKEQEEYLQKINIEYISKIRILLKEGMQKMCENNKKYGVNEDYSHDDFNFDFELIDKLELNKNYDLSYSAIKGVRNKFINDADFIKKHNISEYSL